MKFLSILFIIPFLSFTQDYSQYANKRGNDQSDGRIFGKIKDEKSKFLPYTNISLFSENDTILEGVISDNKGLFIFNNVALGNYKIKISFIGYEDKEVADINITEDNPIVNLKIIDLKPSSDLLDETKL